MSLEDCIIKLGLGSEDAAEFTQLALDNNGNEQFAIDAFIVTMNQQEAQLRDQLEAKGIEAFPGADPASQGLNPAGEILEQQVDVAQDPNFIMWFGASTVVDANGEPLRVYHATDTTFEAFDTENTAEGGSHFGTIPQVAAVAQGIMRGPAADRLSARTLPGYLNISNPIRLEDRGQFDDFNILSQLVEQGLMTPNEMEDMLEVTGGNMAQDFLLDRGYDGVVYLNRFEGVDRPSFAETAASFGAPKDDPDWVPLSPAALIAHYSAKPVNVDTALSDANFTEKFSEARDSYIIFNPEQFKSAFNSGSFSPTDADFLRQSALTKTEQAIGSADTSISQVAVALRALPAVKGSTNLDLGGGRYDLGTEHMASQGVTNLVYDPFNRDVLHNSDVVAQVAATPPATVTVPNVLNVVAETYIQSDIIRQAAKAVAPDGTVYIQIYEGDRSRKGRVTKVTDGEASMWQNNAPLADYLGVASEWFNEVEIVTMPYTTAKGKSSTVKMIAARAPKEVQGQTMWDKGHTALPMAPLKGAGSRSKTYGVGKFIGGQLYVHKSRFTTEGTNIPASIVKSFKAASKKVPFEFNAVRWNPKTNELLFQEAPDFDVVDEPHVGRMWSSKTRKETFSSNVWHHKWQWVGDNYKGFSVSESKSRSRHWMAHTAVGSRAGIGSDKNWQPIAKELNAERAAAEAYIQPGTSGGVAFFQAEVPTVPVALTSSQRVDALIAAKDPRMDDGTVGSLLPHLRSYAEAARDGKPLVLSGDTTNGNAAANLLGLDEVRTRHPNPTASPEAWTAFLADAYARNDVPMPPRRFIEEINNGSQGSIDNLSRLSAGQIADADHGFRNAKDFRAAYINGDLTIATTARLFLWSFLSRGVSPYTQESLFIDAFEGIEGFIEAAADGTLDVQPGSVNETSIDVDMGNEAAREGLKQHMMQLEENARISAAKAEAKKSALDAGLTEKEATALAKEAVDNLATEDRPLEDTGAPPTGDNAEGFEWRVNDDGTVNLTWSEWVRLVAPKGSGQPGAGAAHNLNAFGKNFLIRMAQPAGNGENRSRLQYIHDLMEDPASTGRLIRREFAKLGQGVGIDNKVVSFSLLVSGFDDVMVLDRVQVRQLWDDGTFEGVNLYDGYKVNKKVVTGSSFAKQGDGVKGIMVYEAIEDAIAANIDNIYSTLGREGEGSVGRYHWETWVADSEQEASHGTLDAIMAHARGDNMAIHQVTAKQGEYGSYQYAARYGVDGAGTRYVDYATATGEDYTFTVPQFVEFQRLLKLAKSGVIPKDFLVTETGNEPWYQRAEVDREALDRLAEQIAEGRSGSGAGTFLKDGADEALPPRYTATGFEQAGKQQPRAQFAPYGVMLDQNGKPITLIQMFESADRSSFIHETGHLWLEEMKQDAADIGGSFQRQFSTVLEWMVANEPQIRKEAIEYAAKAVDRAAIDDINAMTTAQLVAYIRTGNLVGFKGATRFITVAMHEQFARGTEDYFMTGQAPSLALADAFAVFSAWLRSIYRAMTIATGRNQLDVKFSPEVKAVMDRLLASEEEINEVAAQFKMMPMFTTAEKALMTPTMWEEYMRTADRAVHISKAKQVSKHMKDADREEREWWKEERETHRDDVEAEVAQQPAQRLLYALLGDTLADGSTIPTQLRLDRLHQKTLKEFMGVERLDALPTLGGKKLYAPLNQKTDTIAPAQLALVFGFDNAEAMVEALITIQPFAELVAAEVEQRMFKEHGSMTSDAAIEAVATVHETDQIGRMLALELAALQDINDVAMKPAFIKAHAAKMFLKELTGKMKSRKFLTLEKKHAAASNTAFRKGDRVEAYKHKFQQLVNHYMSKEALRAEKQLVKDTRYLSKFENRRKKWPKVDAAYIDRIRITMEGYDIGPRLTPEALLKAELLAFNDWVIEHEKDDGAILTLPDHILNKQEKTHYTELPWGDFRDLVDAVKMLEKQGRLRKLATFKGEQVDRDGLADLMISAMLKKGKKRAKHASEEASQGWIRSITGYDAALLKVEMLLELIDGEPLGVWHQAIFEPFNTAEDLKRDLQSKVAKRISDRMEAMTRKEKANLLNTVDVGELAKEGEQWERGELIMLVLNTGNASNLDKLIRGENKANRGLTEAIVAEATLLLNPAEVALVQDIWAIAEEMYPTVEAIARNENGVAPERVIPRDVVTSAGVISGGYFPLMYDSSRSSDGVKVEGQSALKMMQSQQVKASVNSSMTKDRQESFSAPLDFSISNLTRGIDRTVHYISHYDAVRQATQLLNHKVLRQSMIDSLGSEYTAAINNWVGYVASDADMGPTTKLERTAATMARVTTSSILGGAASTMAMQSLGIFTSIDRLMADTSYGPVSFAITLKDIFVGYNIMFLPSKRTAMYDASGTMRHRLGSSDRDLRQSLDVLSKRKGLTARVAEGGLMMIAGMQMYVVDIPSWYAAYNRAMRAEPSNSDKAVLYANRVIRLSQSSGANKDLAEVQRSKGAGKFLTMFYSFMSALYAIQRQIGSEVSINPLTYARFSARMFMVISMPLLAQAYSKGEFPEPEDGEDDPEWATWALKKHAMDISRTVPVVGNIVQGGLGGWGYDLSPVSSFGERLIKAVEGIAEIVTRVGDDENPFEDNELTAEMINIIINLSALKGLPARQASETWEAFFEDWTNDEADVGFFDFLFGYDEPEE